MPKSIRAQTMVIELVGAQIAESILFPDLPPLGANHDFVEAKAFAGVACAASPAVGALLAYAESEARALLSENIDILGDLVDALVECGTLSGDEVDRIIADRVTLRSIEIEHRCRDDWRGRELNAARFLEGKVVIGPPASQISEQQSEGGHDQQQY
jgi:hypothetical protein